MSEAPISISDLISRWTRLTEFAAAVGCGYEAARKMRDRDSIAPEHWSAVVAAAEAHGLHGVTLDWLAARRTTPAPQSETTAAA